MASAALRRRVLQKLEHRFQELVDSLEPEELDALQSEEELVTPLLRVVCGEVSFAVVFLCDNRVAQHLTKRQREIARLVRKGLGNRRIAALLAVREPTIHAHLRRTYRQWQLSRVCLATLVPFLPESD